MTSHAIQELAQFQLLTLSKAVTLDEQQINKL